MTDINVQAHLHVSRLFTIIAYDNNHDIGQ